METNIEKSKAKNLKEEAIEYFLVFFSRTNQMGASTYQDNKSFD
jgi:hypothetical protein